MIECRLRKGRSRGEYFSLSAAANVPGPPWILASKLTWERVYRPDWRKEAGDEEDKPLPAEACHLAAPLERRSPSPLQLVEDPPQAWVIAPDGLTIVAEFLCRN